MLASRPPCPLRAVAERSQRERLQALVRTVEDGDLPKLPEPDSRGNYPDALRSGVMQFKGPTDALQRGDLRKSSVVRLWHSQQAEPIPQRDISLIVLAPTVNETVRDELELSS